MLELTYAHTAVGGGAPPMSRIAQIAIAVPAPGETPGLLVRYEYNAQGQLAVDSLYASGQPILNLVSGLSKIVCT